MRVEESSESEESMKDRINMELAKNFFVNFAISAKTHSMLDKVSEEQKEKFREDIKDFDNIMLNTVEMSSTEESKTKKESLEEVEQDVSELEDYLSKIREDHPEELVEEVEEKIELLKKRIHKKKRELAES